MAKAMPGWGTAITGIPITITTAGITTMTTGILTVSGTIMTIIRMVITTTMFTTQARMRQGLRATATCISARRLPRPTFRG